MIVKALLGPRADAGAGPLDDYWYQPLGSTTAAGMRVGVKEALSSSPVWGATRLLAESVAMLPLMIYQRQADGGKRRADEHPLFDLLHDQPNPLQNSYQWLRMMMVHALLWGNGYSLIRPGPRGVIDTLWPMHPDCVRVERKGNEVTYLVRQQDGREDPYADDQVLHITGLSVDGTSGMGIMQMARESVGVNLAAKHYSSRFFSQGAKPAGGLKTAGRLSKEGRENLRTSWQEIHGGVGNSHRVAILEEGLEWQNWGMTNENAALLPLLEWSAADVARYFNVPLHMIQETSKVTSWGSGIQELSIGFVTYSLMPWLVNWQKAIGKDLIVAPRVYFAEFVPDALLRGSTKERYEAYAIAAGGNAPWLTVNEIRVMENRNPMTGGDELRQPLNMAPTGNGRPSDGAAAHLELMTREAAARIVRKEIAAMDKASRRTAGDAEAWRQAVLTFYGDHAQLVTETLHLPLETARHYVEMQMADMLEKGVGNPSEWETTAVELLTRWALEEQRQ